MDAELRAGMATLFAMTLEDLGATPEAAAGRATDLEEAVHAHAATASGAARQQRYADTARITNAALKEQVGPFPDDVIALQYTAGRLTAGEAVAACLAAPGPPPPREVMLRLFAGALVTASDHYAAARPAALEAARAIEVSCYNAAVRTSKSSEEPTRRQWDSPPFVDIYSTRCGTIYGLLDPASSACTLYGADLVARLVRGELAPGELGRMTVKELCPQATAGERAEIAKRAEQRVVEKESCLFRCPHCGERRSTYKEIQRSSLDEAPDYLCRCLNPLCGHRFVGRG